MTCAECMLPISPEEEYVGIPSLIGGASVYHAGCRDGSSLVSPARVVGESSPAEFEWPLASMSPPWTAPSVMPSSVPSGPVVGAWQVPGYRPATERTQRTEDIPVSYVRLNDWYSGTAEDPDSFGFVQSAARTPWNSGRGNGRR